MANNYKSDADFDARLRAVDTLKYAIADDLQEAAAAASPAQMRVDEAISARPIIDRKTQRTNSRVLFFTTDTSYLERNSFVIQEMKARSRHFDEVHVVVLASKRVQHEPVRRINDRFWVYVLKTEHWWWAPFAARSFMNQHFVFSGGFRPDFVVALDPYTPGLAAYFVGRHFKRPVQVHVPEDFTAVEFLAADVKNSWRRRLATYVLKRVPSIRTTTTALKAGISKSYNPKADVQLLPHFFDVHSFAGSPPSFDVHERYPQYVFIMLYVGSLTTESQCFRVIDAARHLLRSPRIGLIVLGEGPRRKEFEERTRILGIHEQVVFEPRSNDLLSYLKTADVCLIPDTNDRANETVLQAAAAGTAIIAGTNQLRTDLFEDAKNAFLCEPDDTQCYTKRINDLINSNALRTQFGGGAQQVVLDRIVQDPDSYHQAFRDSIETALIATLPPEQQPEASKTAAEPISAPVPTSTS